MVRRLFISLLGLFFVFDLSAVNIYGAAGSVAFSDAYVGPSANFISCHGGDWNEGASVGIFSLNLSNTSSSTGSNIGCRLAKV